MFYYNIPVKGLGKLAPDQLLFIGLRIFGIGLPGAGIGVDVFDDRFVFVVSADDVRDLCAPERFLREGRVIISLPDGG